MMKIITWNIRGLNGKSKQRILRNCIKSEDPDILMLQETKYAENMAEEIFKRFCHTCNYIYTDSKGATNGLAILWNPATVIIEQTLSTISTLTAYYRPIGSNKDGVITNAYGPQTSQEKDLFLNNLSYLGMLVGHKRWIVGGDLNIGKSPAINHITQHIPILITLKHNQALMRDITQEEVDQAIKEMPLGKVPGPDGFTTYLFHYSLIVICEEVWQLIEESRVSRKILPALNTTFLTLIPKEERVTNPKNSRPIVLCNVIYKIITKVIAMSLKPILLFIISEEQSGYLEGRQIMDSVTLVHEVIHSIKTTCTRGMLIKLNLLKDFDHLSWNYMKALLIAFGFENDWIAWVMHLISSIFFSILINVFPSQPFSPT